MSDDSTSRILAALERLEAQLAQTATRDDVGKLRTDLMACMDRLQSRMDSLDEHLTASLGHSDDIEIQSRAVSQSNRILSEQVRSMQKLLRMLENRVAQIEDKKG
jgi:hypothetical protein